MLLQPPPLALYVHLPWCVRKCPYCDFNSHVAPEQLPQQDYVDALLQDLDHDLRWLDQHRLDQPRPDQPGLDPVAADSRPLVSIFFGGGTPSLFSPEEIARFLDAVRQRIACTAEMEVTLEANPGTIEHGRFRGYRDAGITRVSLGAQTFNDQHLKRLGRIHGGGDIQRAVAELVLAGLDNFNLDLMYGLPDQTRAQALEDVRAAIALQPTHLSHYQLTLEPGTVFYHRPPPLPDQDASWEMQVECQQLLAQHGYEQYEVSAYAQPGLQCRHNLNYWEFGDYLGVGAGAHGKLTLPAGAVTRTTRCRQPRDYLSRAAADRITERREVTQGELPFEYMLNALRLLNGFDNEHFEARTGLSRAAFGDTVHAALRKGLLIQTDGGWRPTELGARFLNELQAMFLPKAA